MILLTTLELVQAVRSSLAVHVTPAVDDGFAAVQLAAALVALAEVEARLQGADPCEAEAERLREGLQAIADRDGAPDGIANEVASAVAIEDARERDRRLREILAGLALGDDEATAAAAIGLLTDNGMKTAAEDGAWLCREAMASLQ